MARARLGLALLVALAAMVAADSTFMLPAPSLELEQPVEAETLSRRSLDALGEVSLMRRGADGSLLSVGMTNITEHHVQKAQFWTYVDQKSFVKPGAVEMIEIHIKDGNKPFNVGIYRPTTDKATCQYRLVRQIKFQKGLSVGYHKINLDAQRRLPVEAGDHFGFTWLECDVISFDYTPKFGHYCENQILPEVGGVIAMFNRFTNRNYAIRLSYRPSTYPCKSNPCLHSGECKEGYNDYTCICRQGFTGSRCETEIDECGSKPCQHKGKCNNEINAYSCQCEAGYAGKNCETDINECESHPCQNGGKCTDMVNAFTCACKPGYTGPRCEIDIDDCAKKPCQNGGQCMDMVNGHKCHCLAGYTGRNCETDVNECASHPCQNGGKCNDQVNKYTCTCKPGYTGYNCETDINECKSAPCQNGGSCVDMVNQYKCECKHGYVGKNCETELNECHSHPCQNGGKCNDFVNLYTCTCKPQYTGKHCETQMTVSVTAQTPLVLRPTDAPTISGLVNCIDTYKQMGAFVTQLLTVSPTATVSMNKGTYGRPGVYTITCSIVTNSNGATIDKATTTVEVRQPPTTIIKPESEMLSKKPDEQTLISSITCKADDADSDLQRGELLLVSPVGQAFYTRKGGKNQFKVTYMKSGVFVWKCEAIDKHGLTASSTATVTVVDLKAPTVTISMAESITLPTMPGKTTTEVDCSKFSDADGTVERVTLSVVSPPNSKEVMINTDSKGKFTVTFTKFGSYKFICEAKDNHGLKSASKIATINVKMAPTVQPKTSVRVIIYETSVTEILSLNADDRDGVVKETYVHLIRPTSEPKGFDLQKVSTGIYKVTYATFGVYTFKVIATDNDKLSADATVTVTVLKAPSVKPVGDSPLTVYYGVSTTGKLQCNENDEDGTVVSCVCKLLNKNQPDGFAMAKNGMDYSITYTQPETYVFKCIVTDNHGLEAKAITTVQVRHGGCKKEQCATNCEEGFMKDNHGCKTCKCKEINECQSHPCQHNGQCHNLINKYKCTCQTGYTGYNCETEIDECFSHPCKNGGMCMNKVGSYVCSCPKRFTGVNCETPLTVTISTETVHVIRPQEKPTVSHTITCSNTYTKYNMKTTIQATASPNKGCSVQRVSPTTFRMTYSRPGDFTLSCEIIDTSSGKVIDSDSKTVDIRQPPSVTVQTKVVIHRRPDEKEISDTIICNAEDTDGSIATTSLAALTPNHNHGSALVTREKAHTYKVVYRGSGNFVFRCEATDNDGLKGTGKVTVTIIDLHAPEVEIKVKTPLTLESSQVSVEGTIDCSETSDKDGNIVSISVKELYNPGLKKHVKMTSLTKGIFAVKFTKAGQYQFSCHVKDNNGLESTSTPATIVVRQPPTVAPTSKSPVVIYEKAVVEILITNTKDIDGTIVKESVVLVSPAKRPSGFQIVREESGLYKAIYPEPGVYTFEIIATDNDGLTATDRVSVVVKKAPTTEPGSKSPLTLYKGNSVTERLNCNEKDDDGTVISCNCRLLNSPRPEGFSFSQQGMGYMATYRQTGRYTFSCTVRDNDDLTNTETTVVVVNDGGCKPHKCDRPCPEGYKEDKYNCKTCQCEVIDNCKNSPCKNGGQCNDGINSYTCMCMPGYTGKNCETDINECSSEPCRNGGKCTDQVNHYTCKCKPGYAGTICETDIDECATSPCLNNAKCTDQVNGYQCKCALGFTGKRCETEIDECASVPCQNGGTCNNKVGYYTCSCTDRFTGTHCETRMKVSIDVDTPLVLKPSGSNTVDGMVKCSETYMSSGYKGSVIVVTSSPTDGMVRRISKTKFKVSYTRAGTYQVKCIIVASNTNNAVDEATTTVTVNSEPLITVIGKIEVTRRPDEKTEQTITCSASSDRSMVVKKSLVLVQPSSGAIGEYISGDKYRVIYSSAGSYRFKCVATDKDDLTGSKSIVVTVVDLHAPQVEINTQKKVVLTETSVNIKINCMARDKDGRITNSHLNIIGGDKKQQYVSAKNEDSKSGVFLVTFTKAGRYRFSCKVTDNDDLTGVSNTVVVRVLAPPTLDPKTEERIVIHETTVSEVITSNAKDTDGVVVEVTGKLISPRYPQGFVMRNVNNGVYMITYPTPGVYKFEFVAIDNDKLTATKTVTVVVLQAPTTEPSSKTPLTNYIGEKVTEKLICNERDVDGTVVSCECTLNSKPKPAGFEMKRQGMNYMVTYSTPGSYHFTCKVTDNDQLTNQANLVVVVRNGGCKPLQCGSCPEGYTKDKNNCETCHCKHINNCEPNNCQNNGQCIDGINSYTCECKPGYTGKNCETDINECASLPCKNGGTCSDLINSYKCTCTPGFTGTNCETDIDECASQPCQHGGHCVDRKSFYRCNCKPGYTGPVCETDINECQSEPCQNGGDCTDMVNQYKCSCKPGYTGSNCETDIDECASHPCKHGGICSNLVNKYTCTCPPGFTGYHCETEIDECASHPCQNQGRCVNKINGYLCQCRKKFTGVHCETSLTITIDGNTPLLLDNDKPSVSSEVTCGNNYITNSYPGTINVVVKPSKNCIVNQLSAGKYRLTYTQPGDYKVTCRVTNTETSNTVDKASTVIDVRQPPTTTITTSVSVTLRPGQKSVTETVKCKATDTDSNTKLQTVLTASSNLHMNKIKSSKYEVTYTRAGIYILTCSATDSDKLTGKSKVIVTVVELLAPSVTITVDSPLVIKPGSQDVQGKIDCTKYSDKDGKVQQVKLLVNQEMTRFIQRTEERQGLFSVTYSHYGRYTFTCIVSDDHGLQGISQTRTVIVQIPPTVKPTSNTPIVIEQDKVVEILNGNADDVDGNIVSNVATLVSPKQPTGFSMKQLSIGVYRVTYPTTGFYTFEFTAKDNDGLTANEKIIVEVRKVPTTSPSSDSPVTVFLGETATEILKCNSNDDDGTVVSCKCKLRNSNLPNGFLMQQHGMDYSVTYHEPGKYYFICEVFDNHGLKGEGTTEVTVVNGGCKKRRCRKMCHEGYTKDKYNCDTCQCKVIDNCLPQPCKNNAECIDDINSYSCKCRSGYAGKHCETDINECQSHPCQHGGKCNDLVNRYTCTCKPGYAGINCETEINECASAPCQHRGTCRDKINGYTCKCAPGYTGKHCETEIDECESKPCQHDGQCIDGQNGFTCNCKSGYTGKLCETDIDECTSHPCQHGGKCVDKVNSYKCVCKPGYTGTHCESGINECRSTPCQNDAICHDLINEYKCECKPGFTGKHCETDIDECSSHPCQHGGLCEHQHNSYTCKCQSGYTGINCETDIDECASHPCQHGGSCNNLVNKYTCTCIPGYIGYNCETNIDECASHPCQNSGVCIDLVNTYKCMCPVKYTGKHCETRMTVKAEGNTPLTLRPRIKTTISGMVYCKESYLSSGFSGSVIVTVRPNTATVSKISNSQFKVSYSAPGEYKCTCKVIDSTLGKTVDKDSTIIDVNQPPKAVISGDEKLERKPDEKKVKGTITCSAEDKDSTQTRAKLELVSPIGQAEIHPRGNGKFVVKYLQSGSFVFRCKAKDTDSLTDTAKMTVTVIDLKAPTITVTYTKTVIFTETTENKIDCSHFKDTDGQVKTVVLNVLNRHKKVSVTEHSKGVFAVKYARYGKYHFTCTATDNDGLTGVSERITVSVIMPPTIKPTAPSPVIIYNDVVTEIVTGNAKDKDGSVISNVAKLISPKEPSGFIMKMVSIGTYKVTFPQPGTYTFEFTATDNDDLTATATIAVEVRKAPTVNPNSKSPISVFLGETVTETLTLNEKDEDGTIISFSCSLNMEQPKGFSMTKAGMGYTVTYREPGKYLFTCEVTDNHGLTNKASTLVVVETGGCRPVQCKNDCGEGFVKDSYGCKTCECKYINECLSKPCQNGALCNNLINKYTCTCPIGFTGYNCETDINECGSHPCQHGGTCNDLQGKYTCTCQPKYTGYNCETLMTVDVTGPSPIVINPTKRPTISSDITCTNTYLSNGVEAIVRVTVSPSAGVTVTKTSAVHYSIVYSGPGDYKVTCSIIDKTTTTTVDSKNIVIDIRQPPTVTVTGETTLNKEPTDATVTGTINCQGKDIDGTIRATKLTLVSPAGMALVSGQKGSTYNVEYKKGGNYIWKCTSTDNENLTGSATITTSVIDLQAPTVVINAESPLILKDGITQGIVDCTQFEDEDGNVKRVSLNQLADTMKQYTSVKKVARGKFLVTYSGYGKFDFSCTAVDNHNLKGTSVSVTVSVLMPPTVKPQSENPVVITGTTVTEMLVGNGMDKDGLVVSNVAVLTSPNKKPSGFKMIETGVGVYQVTYPQPGMYTFQFTVTDNDKLTDTGSIIVEVRQGPTTSPSSPSPIVVYTGKMVTERLKCNEKDVDGSVISCSCHLDSLGPKEFEMIQNGFGYTVTYPIAGTYSYTCTVTDNHGIKGEGSTTVIVKDGGCEPVSCHTLCHEGYILDEHKCKTCECDKIDNCKDRPCHNGGQCNDLINDFSCNCQPGFTGKSCETNIDECKSSPCKHGSTCVDQINQYQCQCKPGYTGTNCETDIDECHSHPCQNGGICKDMLNGYTCTCATGYTGPNCETETNECASQPCRNGGQCNNLIGHYTCTCKHQFTGVNCETRMTIEIETTTSLVINPDVSPVIVEKVTCKNTYLANHADSNIVVTVVPRRHVAVQNLGSGTFTIKYSSNGRYQVTCNVISKVSGDAIDTSITTVVVRQPPSVVIETEKVIELRPGKPGISTISCVGTSVQKTKVTTQVTMSSTTTSNKAELVKQSRTKYSVKYTSAGSYIVQCKGIDGDNLETITKITVTVIDLKAPKVEISGDETVELEVTKNIAKGTIDCTKFNDEDGNVKSVKLKMIRPDDSSTITFKQPMKGIFKVKYQKNGVYEFVCTVKDNHGLTGTSIPLSVKVIIAPTVKPSSKTPLVIRETSISETLFGNAEDIDGKIVSSTVRLVSPSQPTGFVMNQISMGVYLVTYPQPGKYVFEVTATDNDDLKAASTITIKVLKAPILAPSSKTPLTLYVGEKITEELSCNGRDVDGNIAACKCTLNNKPRPAIMMKRHGLTYSVEYTVPGTYSFTCTVTDNDELTSEASTSVVIISGGCKPQQCRNCPEGYVKDKFDCKTCKCLEIDNCLDKPCIHGGSCEDGINEYTCKCKPGYTGKNCETDINECAQQKCQNQAKCHDLVNSYRCDCSAGYTGKNCETDINECASHPCQNGGKCNDQVNKYTCTCKPGYTGYNCETDINECFSHPCQHGAGCENMVNMYKCHCQSGYTGTNCETEIDECNSKPCKHDGQCVNQLASYKCVCQVGYTGTNCETEIDECASHPCKNNGRCNNLLSSYTCSCADKYTGKHCETLMTIEVTAETPVTISTTTNTAFGTVSCKETYMKHSYSGSVQLSVKPKKGCTVVKMPGQTYRLTYTKARDYKITCSVISSTTSKTVDSSSTVVDVRMAPTVKITGETELARKPSEKTITAEIKCKGNDIDGKIASSDIVLVSPRDGALIKRVSSNRYAVTYSSQGNYVFRCVATDDEGLTGSAEYTVTVTDLHAPTVTIDVKTPVVLEKPDGSIISRVDCTHFQDKDGKVIRVDLKLNGDDKASPFVNYKRVGQSGMFEVQYTRFGNYQMSCIVEDDQGLKGTSTTQTVEVRTPPVVTPRGQSPLTIQVDTVTSVLFANAEDKDGRVVSIKAQLQSQNTRTGFVMTETSVGVYKVTYPKPGVYTFKYTATDNHGLTGSSTISITVQKAPTVTPSSPSPIIKYIGETVTEKLTCNEKDEDGHVVSCVCHLMTQSIDGMSMQKIGMAYLVTYPAPGSYLFSCKVTDNHGLTNTATTTVVVTNGGCKKLNCENNCPEGYMKNKYGCKLCQCISIDNCANKPCKHDGMCVDGINDYTCKCKPGFTGKNCETDIDECAIHPCQHGGKCNDLINKYTCTCKAGYTGYNCETDINECQSEPCQNGGSCNDLVNLYKCSCKPGYTGNNCETEINECHSKPCQHGGECTDMVNMYKCSCKPGYTGINCETDINECASHPCHNGGKCTDMVNMYKCSCKPGYTGTNCETDINECDSHPCQHGGECTDMVNMYKCSCKPGYSGINCEKDIDECRSHPCQNGAKCVNGVNTYTCQCKPGYTGINCETDINECASKPCIHGKCTDLVNQYLCTCKTGYTGTNCESDIDECSSLPCKNEGKCNNNVNGYVCSCKPGFTGTNCETDINECSSKPCQNGGRCNDMVNGYKCTCKSGYTGVHCETGGEVNVKGDSPLVVDPSKIPATVAGTVQCENTYTKLGFNVQMVLKVRPIHGALIKNQEGPGMFRVVYSRPGDYKFTCIVENTLGESLNKATTTVDVRQPPSVSIRGKQNLNRAPDTMVQSKVSCIDRVDVDGKITESKLVVLRPKSNGVQIKPLTDGHYKVQYPVGGVYVLQCRVTDDEHLTGSATLTVNVKDLYAPTVSVTGDEVVELETSPDSVVRGTVDCSQSKDRDGDLVKFSLRIMHGRKLVQTQEEISTGVFSVTYQSPGKVSFVCQVTDNHGLEGDAPFTVTVKIPPIVKPVTKSPVLLEKTSVVETLNANADDEDGSITRVRCVLKSPAQPQGFKLSKTSMGVYMVTYSTPGVYTFKCSAEDNDRLKASATVTVTVTARPEVRPTADEKVTIAVGEQSVTGTVDCSDTTVYGGSIVSYSLKLLSPKEPTHFSIAEKTKSKFTVTYPAAATYSFQCIVTTDQELVGRGNINVVVDKDTDECLSRPCMNGGKCIDGTDTYSCVCAARYTGTRCETAPDVTIMADSPLTLDENNKAEGKVTCKQDFTNHGFHIRTELSVSPSSVTIKRMGKHSFKATYTSHGDFVFKCKVVDSKTNAELAVANTVVDVKSAPTVTISGQTKIEVQPNDRQTPSGTIDCHSARDLDGKVVDTKLVVVSGDASVKHIGKGKFSVSYNSEGTYMFRCEVKDDEGLVGTSRPFTVNVINLKAPVAVVTGTTKLQIENEAGVKGRVDCSKSHDEDGTIKSYTLSMILPAKNSKAAKWVEQSKGMFSVKYMTYGKFKFVCTVTDNHGLKGTAVFTSRVLIAPSIKPVPEPKRLVMTSDKPVFGLIMANSNDPDGDVIKVTADTSGMPKGFKIVQSTLDMFKVQFSSSGRYAIKFTATDNDGLTSSNVAKIVVTRAPVVEPIAPTRPITIDRVKPITVDCSHVKTFGEKIISYELIVKKPAHPEGLKIDGPDHGVFHVTITKSADYEFECKVKTEGGEGSGKVPVRVNEPPTTTPSSTERTINLEYGELSRGQQLFGNCKDVDGRVVSCDCTLDSDNVPKGFAMKQKSTGVYDVTYYTSGKYTFKCVATDNDQFKATGYTTVVVEAGTAPYVPDVQCLPGNVVITVDTKQLKGVDANSLTLGGCQPESQGHSRIWRHGLHSCHAKVSQSFQDQVVYSWSLEMKAERRSSITVDCSYPMNTFISSYHHVDYSVYQYLGGELGRFNFSMAIYEDVTFTKPFELGQIITIGTPIYTKVHFNTATSLNMFVQQCYAAPTVGFSHVKYPFILPGGCYGKDKTFRPLTKTISSKSYGFEFELFKFSNVKHKSLYMVCDVYVCDPHKSQKGQSGQCHQPHQCDPNSTKKKCEENVYQVTLGPFHPQEPKAFMRRHRSKAGHAGGHH